jgi:hypothetical protein
MLTDAQVAVLCDIGQGASSFDADKKSEIIALLARGFVERDGGLFRLTKLAESALAERGVGLNES